MAFFFIQLKEYVHCCYVPLVIEPCAVVCIYPSLAIVSKLLCVLIFTVLPPEVRIDPIEPVTLGESVSLVCRGFGTPTITYVWRNPQGQIVSTSNVYRFAISSIRQYGYYTCEATNNDGSGSARIEVAAPGL